MVEAVSDDRELIRGIPQGSVIGVILFVLCTNNFSYAVSLTYCRTGNYADDTNMQITARSFQELRMLANGCMSRANDWFRDNYLLLNKDKSTFVNFHTVQSKRKQPQSITLSSGEVQLAEHVKFLGLHIDHRILNQYLDQNALLSVYYATFYTVLRYGIVF